MPRHTGPERPSSSLPALFLLAGLIAAGAAAGCSGTAGSASESGGDAEQAVANDDPAYTKPAQREGAAMWYVDETDARGAAVMQDNGRSDDKFFVEVLGSGAIFFDADRDGDPDLYVVNQRKILPPVADPPPSARFFLNDGKGHFTDATDRSGLRDQSYTLGVCGGDIDNDGDIDLYSTHFDGANVLWRNNGDLTFTDVTTAAKAEGTLDATDSSCAFADVNGDGYLDLYVGYYCDHSLKNNKECTRMLKATGQRVREYCTPRHYDPIPDVLLLNKRDGTFEDISEKSGISAARGRSLGIAFSDTDHDGDQDLYVACDRTASLFYENLGKGQFQEHAAEVGIAVSMDGNEEAGMGVCWGDFNNDGWMDLAKTNYESEMNNMYRHDGGLKFVETNESGGSGAASFPYLGWGTDFFDANNDGRLDYFVANGHLRKDLDQYKSQAKAGLMGYEQYNLFYTQGPDGKFVSLASAAGPGATIRKVHRGTAWADVDMDGDLDMYVTSLHARTDLLINDTPNEGHWLQVRTIGTKSNRDGIGARLSAETDGGTFYREVRSGQSYLSQSDMTVHFGLGAATTVKSLKITWPSGRTDEHANVPADRFVTVTEGGGIEPSR